MYVVTGLYRKCWTLSSFGMMDHFLSFLLLSVTNLLLNNICICDYVIVTCFKASSHTYQIPVPSRQKQYDIRLLQLYSYLWWVCVMEIWKLEIKGQYCNKSAVFILCIRKAWIWCTINNRNKASCHQSFDNLETWLWPINLYNSTENLFYFLFLERK